MAKYEELIDDFELEKRIKTINQFDILRKNLGKQGVFDRIANFILREN